MVLDPKDICVLMLYDDYYAKLAEVTIDKNVKQYCDLHGYTLISHKIENIDNHRLPQWQKIQVSIDILKTNKFKWLFFLDTDCLIMNSTIKLESIIDSSFIVLFIIRQSVSKKNNHLNLFVFKTSIDTWIFCH